MDLQLPPETLNVLRCPRTGQRMRPVADPDEVAAWQALDGAAEGFLVTEDGRVAYPVEEGFPVLLLERALERAGYV